MFINRGKLFFLNKIPWFVLNLALKYKTDRHWNKPKKPKKKIPKESSLFLWLVKNHDDWSKWLMTFTPYILSFPEHKKQSHPQIWCAWNTQSEMVCLKGVIKAYLRFIWEKKRNGKKPYPLSIDKSEKIELQKRHAPMPVLSRLYFVRSSFPSGGEAVWRARRTWRRLSVLIAMG